MKFTSTALSALLLAMSATAIPTKLKELLVLPILTNKTAGTVTVWGGEPIDIATVNDKVTIKVADVDQEFTHVTDLFIESTERDHLQFDYKGVGQIFTEQCAVWAVTDPNTALVHIILNDKADVVLNSNQEEVKLECMWTNM